MHDILLKVIWKFPKDCQYWYASFIESYLPLLQTKPKILSCLCPSECFGSQSKAHNIISSR